MARPAVHHDRRRSLVGWGFAVGEAAAIRAA
jgi:hypothetical protein